MAALALYMLVIDGEASPQIACLGNSREQARILFEYITKFAQSIDKKSEFIKYYRNYVATAFNNGTCKVYSADASKLDGLNISLGVVDEYHEAKDRKLYDVMKSSMGMREQPLMVVITTAGYDLESPCHSMYQLSLEILNNIKQDDTFFPFIYMMDAEDDWEDESNWVKCQPNLGVTVTYDYMRAEHLKAKNDATAEVGVKTKTFNMWCQSSMTWIPAELIARKMANVDLEDYRGEICYVGVDLGAVSDLTSLSIMIVRNSTYVFKTYTFLPADTLKDNPNEELYNKFIQEGSLILTPGNVTDYDFVINKIVELNEILNIEGIYYDKWNSTTWAIKCTELGFNMVPFSQGVANFNNPTKEFERIVKSDEATVVIDKSANILWQFTNVTLKVDYVGNIKPAKNSAWSGKKVDSVISMITCLGGYLSNPYNNDYEIFTL